MSALARLDEAGLRLARTAGHTPAAESAVRRFSALGEHAAIWLALACAGAVADVPRRRRWRIAGATVAGAYALNTAIKLVARRRRPDLPGLAPLVGTPTDLSFPSAHATTAFTAGRAYAPLLAARFGSGARVPLWGVALALPLSRLYLGVHYPSDLVAGAALGYLLGGVSR